MQCSRVKNKTKTINQLVHIHYICKTVDQQQQQQQQCGHGKTSPVTANMYCNNNLRNLNAIKQCVVVRLKQNQLQKVIAIL